MKQEPASLPPRSGSRKAAVKAAKPPKNKKKRSLLKIVFTIMFSIVLIVGAAAVYLLIKTNDAINTIGADNPEISIPKGESVSEKPVAIALMGIDTRPKGGTMNTDVMMVASFNPQTKKAVVVSIPRDSLIEAEGYRARKANRIYADFYMAAKNKKEDQSVAEAKGQEAVREVLGKLLGIDIKYASIINFQGFSDVVDALGGIQVDVDMRMKYSSKADGTDIDLDKGVQQLLGKEALDFVRYRQSNDGSNPSSDFDRNRRQTEVLSAIADKLISLEGAAKLGSVIDAVSGNVKTDMPSGELKRMMATYFGVRSSDITSITLEGSWRSPYVHLKADSLAEARAKIQENMAQ